MRWKLVDRRVLQLDGAPGWAMQSSDSPEQCRLTGAVRSDQGDKLTLSHLERGTPERLQVAVEDVDTLNAKHGGPCQDRRRPLRGRMRRPPGSLRRSFPRR